MAAFSFVTNYFLIYPIYGKVMGGIDKIVCAFYTAILPGVTELWQALVIFNVAVHVCKGLMSVVISMLIYKKTFACVESKSSTQSRGASISIPEIIRGIFSNCSRAAATHLVRLLSYSRADCFPE